MEVASVIADTRGSFTTAFLPRVRLMGIVRARIAD